MGEPAASLAETALRSAAEQVLRAEPYWQPFPQAAAAAVMVAVAVVAAVVAAAVAASEFSRRPELGAARPGVGPLLLRGCRHRLGC